MQPVVRTNPVISIVSSSDPTESRNQSSGPNPTSACCDNDTLSMAKDKLAALLAAQSDNSDCEDALDVPLAHPMDAFFAETRTLHDTVSRIQTCVQEVQQLHSAIITAPQKDPSTAQKLEDLTAEIKDGAGRVRLKLKQMRPEDGDETSAANRMRATQHVTLSKRIADVMSEYNRAQVDYGERIRGKLQRQLEIAGKRTTDEELEEMLEEGTFEVFTEDIVTETRQEQQRVADIEARHADLVKVETSIRDLHDMFVDMAMLVEGQGELMDRIEYHVGSTREAVEEGQKDLKKAKEWHIAARKKKIMVLMCLIVAAIIGIAVLVAFLF